MDTTYQSYDSSGLLAALMGMAVMFFFFAVALYVVQAIFQMKLLKNAGHKYPASAWVPLWNTVTLFEIGGIRMPWAWVAVLFGAGLLSSIPVLGLLISLALVVVSVILSIWMAKGVQAGTRTGSTGGIVLAVLLPIVWVIWQSLASEKTKPYDVDAAIAAGGEMPINWFGQGNPREPFVAAGAGFAGSAAPAAYSQAPAPGTAWNSAEEDNAPQNDERGDR